MLNALTMFTEKVTNKILKLDPQAEILLQKLNSESLALYFTDWNLRLVLIPNEKNIQFYQNKDMPADAELSGSSSAFIKALFDDMPQMLFYSKELQLKGTLKTVLAWRKLYLALSPELSYWLEPYLGQTLTYHLSKPMNWLKNTVNQFRKTTTYELREYITEEAKFFPAKEAVNNLNHNILLTGIDAERIQQKLYQLKGSKVS